MRLADFIAEYLDLILTRWHALARATALPVAPEIGRGPRDHPARMLQAISARMAAAQAGAATPSAPAEDAIDGALSPAAQHGAERLLSGFTIEELVAEYRALRTSVLRLWVERAKPSLADEVDDIIRLNDAIDQAQAESVGRYATMLKQSQHLFLAILGHDLRNPLNTTVVAAGFLMRAPGIAPGHAEVAARIHRSGARMGRLVDDLIDYTRTKLGCALPMTLAKGNMGSICSAVVDEMRQINPHRAIQFEPGSDLDGVWDEGRLAQVFSNLLGNAIQYGDRSEPVSLQIESGGNGVVVRIHNSGKAIAPQALATIFDPLVRFADPRHAHGGADSSLGIGLYIARAIVEAHGGDIGAVSDERSGTTFTVRLPRVPPRAPVLAP